MEKEIFEQSDVIKDSLEGRLTKNESQEGIFGVGFEKEMKNILSSGKYPCRNIDHNMADLAAQVAANKTGINEINSMVDQFGIETVQAYTSNKWLQRG